MWLRAILSTFALAACVTAHAPEQQRQERPPPVHQRVIDQILTPPPEGDADLGGAHAQALAFVGREDLSWTIPRVRDRPFCAPSTRDGAPIDPIEEIVVRATEAQVVIVNEAHHDPHHRAFIAQVAERLRALGFSVYAAETFSTTAAEHTETWPRLTDGYYSREPIFGALLRRVRELGYQLVAYEHIPRDSDLTEAERVARREEGQAANLRTRILERDPNARVLIHAGHGHVRELRDNEAFGPMMARRFKQMTGMDPLTIDQTRYAAPAAGFVVCDPAAIEDAGVDIYIASPNPASSRSRPTWRRDTGHQEVELPRAFRPVAEPTVVEARFANEPDEAVPADRILVRPGEDVPLLLPPGDFRIEAWTSSSGWSRSVHMSIPGRS
jgi:hypothetical protein